MFFVVTYYVFARLSGTPVVGEEAQMRTYTPRAILRSCYLQREIDLGGSIRAVPLDKKLGFQGELQYVFDLLPALKITSDTMFKDSVTQQLAHAQPMAMLELPTIEAANPYEVEETIMRWIRVSCGTLSVLTTNMVEPIAYIMTSQSGHELKMLPPKESIVVHVPQCQDTSMPRFRFSGTPWHTLSLE